MKPPDEEKTPPVIVVPEPVIVAAEMPALVRRRYAHASNYSPQKRRRTIAIVVHATAGHEGPTKDDDVAAMFAKRFPPGQKARSCTFVVDSNSFVQCVPDDCIAWHCGATGNRLTEGVELCGQASQTRAQWFDAMSFPMLCLAARLIAWRCELYSIPVRFADAAMLRAGLPGITTHAEVSKAWRESNHTDPGPDFPMEDLLRAIRRANTQP